MNATQDYHRALALAMALHPRLGALSPLAHLPPDCLRRVAYFLRLLNARWLRTISARTGCWVDALAFHYSDGTSARWGGSGGTECEPFHLLPGEFLIGVRGCRGDHVDALAFLTSRGRSSPTWGGPGGSENFELVAPPGTEVISLDVEMGREYPTRIALRTRCAPSDIVLAEISALVRPCYCTLRPAYAPVATATARLCMLTARSGEFVNGIEFHYSDGTATVWGGSHGALGPPFCLEPNESLLSVRTWTGATRGAVGGAVREAGLQFVTSLGRASPVYGRCEGAALELGAPPGEHVHSLSLRVTSCGSVADLGLCTRHLAAHTPSAHACACENRAHWAACAAPRVMQVNVHTDFDFIEGIDFKMLDCPNHFGCGRHTQRLSIEAGAYLVALRGWRQQVGPYGSARICALQLVTRRDPASLMHDERVSRSVCAHADGRVPASHAAPFELRAPTGHAIVGLAQSLAAPRSKTTHRQKRAHLTAPMIAADNIALITQALPKFANI